MDVLDDNNAQGASLMMSRRSREKVWQTGKTPVLLFAVPLVPHYELARGRSMAFQVEKKSRWEE
jgi:hypothetical protein